MFNFNAAKYPEREFNHGHCLEVKCYSDYSPVLSLFVWLKINREITLHQCLAWFNKSICMGNINNKRNPV